MSCRHSLRSKPIEALMSCMMTEGPLAKRPPHCALASSVWPTCVDPVTSRCPNVSVGRRTPCSRPRSASRGGPRWCGANLARPPIPAIDVCRRVDARCRIPFTTADGEVRTLKDYAGRGVVLNFWATWCIPCVAEMPALDDAGRSWSTRRVMASSCCRCRRTGPVGACGADLLRRAGHQELAGTARSTLGGGARAEGTWHPDDVRDQPQGPGRGLA